MEIRGNSKTFQTININGDEYIKVKDINEIVIECYRSKMQRGLFDILNQFDEFIKDMQEYGFDIEKETRKLE